MSLDTGKQERCRTRSRGGRIFGFTVPIEEQKPVLYEQIITGDIPVPIRIQMLNGTFKNTDGTKSLYNKERWQFMLFAPFEISNLCCRQMKKNPAHTYHKESGRFPLTAEMASESLLRASVWMKQGCNGFDSKKPKSMPMAFWTEQDVLAYIKSNNIEIAAPYGSVVADYGDDDHVDGQMDITDYMDFGVFDLEVPPLKTTGCSRTGCIACGFGIHIEKPPGKRLYDIIEHSNPKVLDWILRGGAFSEEDGIWRPDNRGLGFWFLFEWVNAHGGFKNKIDYPNREHYIETYMTKEAEEWINGPLVRNPYHFPEELLSEEEKEEIVKQDQTS